MCKSRTQCGDDKGGLSETEGLETYLIVQPVSGLKAITALVLAAIRAESYTVVYTSVKRRVECGYFTLLHCLQLGSLRTYRQVWSL